MPAGVETTLMIRVTIDKAPPPSGARPSASNACTSTSHPEERHDAHEANP
jgi:hypothetical protein